MEVNTKELLPEKISEEVKSNIVIDKPLEETTTKMKISKKDYYKDKIPFKLDTKQLLPYFKLDYVILNCPSDPVPIIKRLKRFMNPNCRIIIYDRYYSKINEAYNYLKAEKEFIMVEVSDFLVREYQVFHLRTHPMMKGPLSEGFFLNCYKVERTL